MYKNEVFRPAFNSFNDETLFQLYTQFHFWMRERTHMYIIGLDIEKNINDMKLKKCINFSCHLVALSRIIGECFPQNLMLLGETLHY
jgi:hypothetical protein